MSFLHWGGHATQFPFLPKICELAPFLLRLHHTPSFFTKNPQVGTFACWGCATQHSQTAWQGAKGIASKGLLPTIKGIPHGACKQHASNTSKMQAKHKHSAFPLHSSSTLLPTSCEILHLLVLLCICKRYIDNTIFTTKCNYRRMFRMAETEIPWLRNIEWNCKTSFSLPT